MHVFYFFGKHSSPTPTTQRRFAKFGLRLPNWSRSEMSVPCGVCMCVCMWVYMRTSPSYVSDGFYLVKWKTVLWRTPA